ncbi:MAG: ATP synthase F1 subunit gamma [Candidatus Eremiobacteraeota bacterium]|nr:ATP synthase F1 subunit gamma [Candidatus Eremiobacteraeota bacterium]
MPSFRDLRARIRSVTNTQQITKAMKQVASAKIRRAENLRKEARPYADAMGQMLDDLFDAVGTIDHPFARPGPAGAPRAVVLVTGDKGLAGSFNSNVTRSAEIDVRGSPTPAIWYAIGLKGRNTLRRLSFQIAYEAPILGDKMAEAREVARRVGDDFAAGKLSEVVMISPRLISMLTQRPERRQLLPIVGEKKKTEKSGPRAAVEFVPSPEFVLARLLPKYLGFTIFSALLETDAAYYAAQLLAMTNATDNADELIDTLTVEMNKARQGAITKEILEIVGGAEAVAGVA